MRGERVAFGMMWAYFVAESGHFDGKRANKGSMIFGGSRDDP